MLIVPLSQQRAGFMSDGRDALHPRGDTSLHFAQFFLGVVAVAFENGADGPARLLKRGLCCRRVVQVASAAARASLAEFLAGSGLFKPEPFGDSQLRLVVLAVRRLLFQRKAGNDRLERGFVLLLGRRGT